MTDTCEIKIVSTADLEQKKEADRTGWWAHAVSRGYFVMHRQMPPGTTLSLPQLRPQFAPLL